MLKAEDLSDILPGSISEDLAPLWSGYHPTSYQVHTKLKELYN